MTSELKAGLFVVAAIAALVVMTTKLTQNNYSMKGVKRYYVHVKDATGLFAKTKVRMAGLDVGGINTVELVDQHAKVTLEVAADVILHKDATMTIKSIGFLGDKYVELNPGSSASPVLDEGGTLAEGSAGGGIEDLTKKTGEVMDNIKEITQVLKEALKGSGDDEESRLERILDNTENFTAGLSSIEKYGELADRLNEVAINVREITDKVKKGEGTVGKLLTDSETIDRLNNTLSGVNKLITKVDRTALWIDARGGALTKTGGSKSYFSLAFQPTYDKYYLFGINTGPKKIPSVTRTTTTTAYGTDAAATTTKEESEVDPNGIFINAQFGKRFSNTVARLGIFESTAGFGIDQFLMNDKMKLYTELYRFGARSGDPTKAHINLGSEFHVYRPFYIWLGGDDLISAVGTRNVFIGAGLRFSDNDLKTVVGTAAASGALR